VLARGVRPAPLRPALAAAPFLGRDDPRPAPRRRLRRDPALAPRRRSRAAPLDVSGDRRRRGPLSDREGTARLPRDAARRGTAAARDGAAAGITNVTKVTSVASPYSGRIVLVLGATGFIGRWVAFALERAGALTCLAVRNADATKPLFESLGLRGRVLVADLTDADRVAALVAECKPAAIFNLAGYGVDPAERDPAIATKLNAVLP